MTPDSVHRLEPTAALVMLWAQDLYRTGSPARFCASLDLDAGREMKRRCDEVCPWYREVILNRKWLIARIAAGFIRETTEPCQVIIPAAGKSPLALELLERCGRQVAGVIEIDIAGMEEKQLLYERAVSGCNRIRCITADLRDPAGMHAAIHSTGMYDPGLRTVIIAEGISYYVPHAVIAGIAGLFATGSNRNLFVLDYLLPCRLVPPDMQGFPRGIWRIINHDCGQERTITFTPEAMEKTLQAAGTGTVLHHTMDRIERDRTGTNTYFSRENAGWIRIAEAQI